MKLDQGDRTKDDFSLFQRLNGDRDKLFCVVKAFRKRQKSDKGAQQYLDFEAFRHYFQL
jgi:hypothetical protein